MMQKTSWHYGSHISFCLKSARSTAAAPLIRQTRFGQRAEREGLPGWGSEQNGQRMSIWREKSCDMLHVLSVLYVIYYGCLYENGVWACEESGHVICIWVHSCTEEHSDPDYDNSNMFSLLHVLKLYYFLILGWFKYLFGGLLGLFRVEDYYRVSLINI